jgi:hypothetical protein
MVGVLTCLLYLYFRFRDEWVFDVHSILLNILCQKYASMMESFQYR